MRRKSWLTSDQKELLQAEVDRIFYKRIAYRTTVCTLVRTNGQEMTAAFAFPYGERVNHDLGRALALRAVTRKLERMTNHAKYL